MFAHQGMEIIKTMTKPQPLITGNYIIKPLNVLKQIFTMFFCADKSGHLLSQKDLVEFVLTREKRNVPSKYKIFLYSTLSPKKRMIGYSVVYAGIKGIQKWSEINFQPFGYLLAEESIAAQNDQYDITSFGNSAYDEQVSIEITTPYLNVDSPWIGTYA